LSKLNSDKINYNENNFLVQLEKNNYNGGTTKQELLLNRAQDKVDSANEEAEKIIEEAKIQAESIVEEGKNQAKIEAEKIIEEAKIQAESIVEEGNATKNEILTNAQTEVERASQESAQKGYEEGYQDSQNKFYEENEEKILAFEKFCEQQNIIKDKILKNASREILNIIQNISKNILLKELDSDSLDKIIKKTISLFEKKEKIVIIVSEKYARLLYELQKKESDIELNFEDFKQYRDFDVVYNSELPEDTIIIENPKERFCASIQSQLDKIMREILENTQSGNIETEEYEETE